MKHPGLNLQEELKKSNMTRSELALRTGVTEKHISTIINGSKGISTSFANKLGYVFRNTDYWLNLQSEYDKEQWRVKEENNITPEEVKILKPLKEIYAFFVNQGYIKNSPSDAEKVMRMRGILQVSDLTVIPQITYNAAYRAQLTSNVKVDPYVLFAWQRLCEKETESLIRNMNNGTDIEKLRKEIPQIKQQMFCSISKGIEELQKIFFDCGIAFCVVQNFRGAPVQGFIKQTSNGQLILCLTIRNKRADSFWFTLFHEIAHILNEDYRSRFVDFDSVQSKSEEMADLFAQDVLIDPNEYRVFIRSTETFKWNDIESFAKKIGVEPFIVLGRLQRDGIIDWIEYANKVVKYTWA